MLEKHFANLQIIFPERKLTTQDPEQKHLKIWVYFYGYYKTNNKSVKSQSRKPEIRLLT